MSELIERIDDMLDVEDPMMLWCKSAMDVHNLLQDCKAALSQQAELVSILESTIQTGMRIDAKVAQQEAGPVAWITECQCIGPEFGKRMYGELPVQSLQPGYYKHIPLYLHPPKTAPLQQPTKGICNDERACPACYSGQGKCTNSSPLIGDCKNQDCDRLAPEGMYCEVCAEVAQPVASEIPCARCGGDCVEFTVPNAIWNAVIRPDGKERDDEYLCIDCWHRELDAHLSRPQDDISQYTVSCGCGDMFKPDSRGSAFIDIFGECENCRAASSSQPVASVSQDLREFIYTKGNSAAQFGDSQDVILVSDFEQFMAQRESAKPLSQGLEEFIAAKLKMVDICQYSGRQLQNILFVMFSTWMAGHARVPVEPTQKMIDDGEFASTAFNSVEDIWRMMIAASQQEGV